MKVWLFLFSEEQTNYLRAEIELGIAELATKSHEKKITLQELQGGTFSITNGGVFGSLMYPLLNPPQVGILGMHK